MSIAGLVFSGIAALIAAGGAGASAAGQAHSSRRMADQDREARAEELRKNREQENFQFGYSQMADQRRSAEQRASRSVFNEQFLSMIGGGKPPESTF